MVNFIKILIIILITSFCVYTQKVSKEFSKNRSELEKIKKEINELDAKIKNLNKKQLKEIKLLDSYEEQEKLLSNLIKLLENEQNSIENQIKMKEAEVQKLTNELDRLKTEYARNIRSLYIHRHRSDIELLFSSASLNQAILRMKYLKRFTEDRIKTADELVKKANQLKDEQKLLAFKLANKEEIVKAKMNESNLLTKKKEEKKKLIEDLKKDKKNLLADLERKKESAVKIQNMINELIRKEREQAAKSLREQREKLAKNKEAKSTEKSTIKESDESIEYTEEEIFPQLPKFSSFSLAKGKLPWPVASGKIIGRYGEQRNEQLNTVTLNFGVDIATPVGSNVRAVSDGVISAISWLPGYGNIVIIRHSEGYRTVYGNLSNVFVAEGQLVKIGEFIGISGSSLSGESIHFEIWKDRERQNPEVWLARR